MNASGDAVFAIFFSLFAKTQQSLVCCRVNEGSVPANETVELRPGASALVVMRLVPLPPPPEPEPKPAPEVAPIAAQPKQPPDPATIPPAPVAVEPIPVGPPEPATPAALDLTAAPTEVAAESTPIYKTWWFWTGAAVVG